MTVLFRLALALVDVAAGLVPAWRRNDWRRQWQADLCERWRALERHGPPGPWPALDLLARAIGVFRHALWLRRQEWSLEMLMQDLRYGLRLLWRRPAFTAVAVLTLGLGIGANATIFSWIETMVLRPLPGVPDTDRLVVLNGSSRTRSNLSISYPDFADLRSQLPAGVSGLLAHRLQPMTLRSGAEPERVWGSLVSGNYFDVLGVRAALGRTFQAEEDRTPDTHPVVVLSYRCWQRRFQAAPDIVGRTVLLDEHPFTVVGVAAERFAGTDTAMAADLWVPMMMQHAVRPGDQLNARGDSWLKVMARLAPGASITQAQPGFRLAAARLAAAYPAYDAGRGIVVYPLWRAPQEASGMMAPVLIVLMAVVAVVLLIACANVASLLLVRAAGRRREVAMRLALGASRGRLIRQLLTESVLLALLGGALGVVLANWTARLLTAFVPPTRLPLSIDAGVSPRVFLFALGLTLVTGLVFGLAPAWQSSRPDLVPALKDGGEGTGRTRRALLRRTLVAGQVALALLLLVTAALFLRTLDRARAIDPGFSLRSGVLASIDLQPVGYDAARGEQFYRTLLRRLREVPGVRAATLAQNVPLSFGGNDTSLEIEGYVPARDEEITIYYTRVGPDYFETMGIPILRGRAIDETDGRDSARAIVINETMARRYWKGRDAVGRRVRWNGDWLTVAGIAADGKYGQVNEAPRSFMYVALLQDYRPSAILHVATAGDPLAVVPAITRQVHDIDPRLPLFDVLTVAEQLQLSVFLPRLGGILLGVFGLLALVLATTGLYGVLAHLAAQRTREIGIRMTLGAARGDVVRMVLRQGLALTLIGLVVGLVAAAAAARLLASQLIGVGPLDPVSFAGTSLLLLAAATLACYLPARRAAGGDPLRALRCE